MLVMLLHFVREVMGLGLEIVWKIYMHCYQNLQIVDHYGQKTFRLLHIIMVKLSLKILALLEQKSHSLIWMLAGTCTLYIYIMHV